MNDAGPRDFLPTPYGTWLFMTDDLHQQDESHWRRLAEELGLPVGEFAPIGPREPREMPAAAPAPVAPETHAAQPASEPAEVEREADQGWHADDPDHHHRADV